MNKSFFCGSNGRTSTSTPLPMPDVSKQLDQADYKNSRDIESEEGVFKSKRLMRMVIW